LEARKRIQSEIVRVSGDRISELEVTVSGKQARIRAVVTRFYFRRAVRREIESVGALRGFLADIDVR
jgi:hypothetical protein